MVRKIIKNFILYTFSFFLALFLHKGAISFNGAYDKYYEAFIISWAVSALLSRKFKSIDDSSILDKLYRYTISFFLMLGIYSINNL